MEPTTYGIVSIVPVIVLIVVALITKRTFESLLIATLLALILGYKGDWFYALIEQIQTVSAENVWVLLVVGLLGGLVGVLEKSRAAMGFTGVLSRFATTKKRSLLAEWLLSVVLFVDDYLNILATGSITKRLNDSHRIHRTMTAYVIGSTSAPVVVLIPLSSWSIYYASLIDTTGIVPEGGSATLVYIQSIPFMFYPMLCLLVLLLVITGVIPLFGPMRKFQKEAEETGVLFPDGKPVGQDDADPFPEEPPAKSRHTAGLWDLVLPIAVLVAATIIFDIDVLTGVVVALIFTGILYLARRLMSIAEYVDGVWEGFSTMVSVLALLVIAFMFKSACESLGMDQFIIEKVAPPHGRAAVALCHLPGGHSDDLRLGQRLGRVGHHGPPGGPPGSGHGRQYGRGHRRHLLRFGVRHPAVLLLRQLHPHRPGHQHPPPGPCAHPDALRPLRRRAGRGGLSDLRVRLPVSSPWHPNTTKGPKPFASVLSLLRFSVEGPSPKQPRRVPAAAAAERISHPFFRRLRR